MSEADTPCAENAEAATRKRPKAANVDLTAVTSKIQQKESDGRLKELTIAELKCYLKAHKKPVGGKKEELVARLIELLGHPA